ncbi:hypothetical protein C4K04_5708 [Pseudomonas chlororaphis]|uniref:Uncharacterized protein n=1 Tax=Pseudomonas chlororaphis TaxID=587753 RepID=A0A3G7TYP8_9PSED|nr:hypothetical protein C4K04_5708 [Pseudomonas chlororaphis]
MTGHSINIFGAQPGGRHIMPPVELGTEAKFDLPLPAMGLVGMQGQMMVWLSCKSSLIYHPCC